MACLRAWGAKRSRVFGAAVAFGLAILVVGCATGDARAQAPKAKLSPEVKWFRDSAERRVAFAQAYFLAWQAVQGQLAKGPVGRWAVILDADETIIDNSEFEKRVALGQVEYKDPTWDAWLTEQAKRAFESPHDDFVFAPAREFISRIHAAGGLAIIVTNRVKPCDRTATVLQYSGGRSLAVDALLCADDATSGKEKRFADIQDGAIADVGRVNVLLYVGDNILDCQGQSQQKYDEAIFGSRCIVLPNPMYGSWTNNPND